ncbi:MFS transporter [uncultured Phenylobacterium sp.]|uniref:MFS transporter n=1 Tax=uncultured Phenylobacterium sp. TaxID=349273 RepID=UPI0025E92528|nr:MFS transporter [uncultured Phenylobacterium sp.]
MSRAAKGSGGAHPYVGLLKDRGVRTLWAGQALSDAGGEMYRLGAIWLAVGMAGADAAWLPIAQSGAMLAFALGAGAVVDGLSSRKVMIWADLIRAAVSAAVVAAAFTVGLSLPLLIAAGVLLAGVQAVFDPALQAVIPRLMPDPHRLRALNGLFDVTGRLAVIAGSALGAAIAALAAPIHLLTANSASFLASAGSIALAGHRFDGDTPAQARPATVLQRLSRGWRAARATPGARTILATAAVSYATRSLGIALGLPLLLVQGGVAGGLGTLALVMAATAVGDGLTNLITVTWRVRDGWRFLFAGYVLRGMGLAGIGAGALFAPPGFAPLAMAAAGFVLGVGGSMAFLQMMPFFQTRMDVADATAVFRLRYAILAAATMAGALLAPAVFRLWTPAPVIITCGAVLALAGLCGARRSPAA